MEDDSITSLLTSELHRPFLSLPTETELSNWMTSSSTTPGVTLQFWAHYQGDADRLRECLQKSHEHDENKKGS